MRHAEFIWKLESCFAGWIDTVLKAIKRCCQTDPEAIAAAMSAVANQGKA